MSLPYRLLRSTSTTRLAPFVSPTRFLRCSESSFHSYQHLPPPPPFSSSAESSILSAALRHVPEHGFSETALIVGAREAGYLDISINLFPRGVFDLVHYHLVRQRLELGERVQFPEGGGSGPPQRPLGISISDKIRALCIERLKGNTEIIHRWQEALAIMSMPSNLPTSLTELAELADEMWYLAGDKSVDTTWYTKRASLSAIYASTELFMTQDNSPDFGDTWDFLDRRLEDVYFVGKAASEVGAYLAYTGHAMANILRSKGFRIPF